ncbi:MAG: hypothetical protein ASARMPRED_008825 [Alectoria sarmentosa]|nr:MAG: hypothetical protein ASARMPRED_008825 [Alectoria sarmentosa]
MTDQNNRGFRKFMLDPKNSVMTYIADNIPPEHLSQQHQQGSSGRLQHGPTNGQQQQQQDPSRPQQNQPLSQPPQNQSHQDGFMRPPLPTRPSQSNSPSSSPRPGYAQPVRSSQMSLNTPYVASKVSQANQGLNGYAGAQSQGPGSQSMSNSSLAQESVSQQGPQSQYSSVQNGGPSAAVVGQGPPQPGARRRNSPQSAPRLYHRMMLEFEITKKTFFLAKSQHNTHEMASTAYELESSSRRIWGLRYEHSWEFEGYSEAGHQAVFSKWQAEYEMWADTVLDIQDGQILADVANPSKYGHTSMHRDAEDWDSRSRHDRAGFQELNGEIQHPSPSMRLGEMLPHMPQQMAPNQQVLPQQQMPLQQQMSIPQQMPPQQQFPPPQQMPQLQTLSMDQSKPPSQSMQSSQRSWPVPPESFPQNGPPPTFSDQNMPPQQRQQSPQPPQMPIIQSPPPNMQNGQSMQPDQLNASPNIQNAPIGLAPNVPDPNMQQPQNTRPGQPPNTQQAQTRPPQQYTQQNQGMPSDPAPKGPRQQILGLGQQGPPRNGMSPGQSAPQSQNMGPRQNPSSRPGSQVPSSLQAGGQMLGGGRS